MKLRKVVVQQSKKKIQTLFKSLTVKMFQPFKMLTEYPGPLGLEQ